MQSPCVSPGGCWRWLLNFPWRRIIRCSLFVLLSVVVCEFTEAVSMYHLGLIPGPGWPKSPGQENPVLPDVGFSLIPYSAGPCNADLCTYLVLFVVGSTFLFLTFALPNDPERRALTRWMTVIATLVLLRSATETWTTVNNPNPRCNGCGYPEGCPKSVGAALVLMIQHFPFHLCGGLMFSGHTFNLLVSAYAWMTYFPYRSAPRLGRLFCWTVYAATSVGVLSLIGCRYHYTMDCVVALWMSGFVWWVYHDRLTAIYSGTSIAVNSDCNINCNDDCDNDRGDEDRSTMTPSYVATTMGTLVCGNHPRVRSRGLVTRAVLQAERWFCTSGQSVNDSDDSTRTCNNSNSNSMRGNMSNEIDDGSRSRLGGNRLVADLLLTDPEGRSSSRMPLLGF